MGVWHPPVTCLQACSRSAPHRHSQGHRSMPYREGPQPPSLPQSLAILMSYQNTDACFYGSGQAHL